MPEPLQEIDQALDLFVIERRIEVPMLPEVANKALTLAQDPDAGAMEMAKLIQSDQSLADHVMRIANSAAYSPMSNLVSLQQAVARLGMGVMSEIALSASLGAKLFNTPGYEQHIAQHWQRALSTGLWAKEVARQTRTNVEVAFLAGLLHSIGYPAVLQTVLDIAKQQDVELDEQQVLHLVDKHAHEVSIQVVTEWKMPTLVIAAIRQYLSYDQATEAAMQSAQVYAANQIALAQQNNEELTSLAESPVFASLNLYQDEVAALFDSAESVADKLQGLTS